MKNSVRLSGYVKPERYQISLRPDLENFTFWGEETIDLNLEKSTKQITLHARDLEIQSAEWIQGKHTSWAGKISYNEKKETATFTFPKSIPSGKGQLKLTFVGILNDKLRGFYRSKYVLNGKETYLATTQFESTDARRAFPCFDEPSQKAVFEVTLLVPTKMTAISNTIESKVWEHEAGIKAVQFIPTPKMSTYLLAFIVGDLEFLESKTANGVLVRVFTTPGKKSQGKFALDVAVKCLEFYEKYFDIKYPLPTLDLIAIPDFAAGAMENWGVVTYRETALLIDPVHSAAANRQRVAIVIAHELAHQWFGNLVTMEWWTHLWLNEGFASYMEYLAIDELFPQWQMWTQFVMADFGEALKLDSLKNTHPIEVEVHHPDEISEIFDAISYSKGASVIRMLAEFLGYKNFRNGMRHYLKKHKYGNAATEDLWKALEEVSGQPVVKLMKNWTGKSGHPVIRLQEVAHRPQLRLTQDRFFSSPLSKKEIKDTTLWTIPVKITTSSSLRKQGSIDNNSKLDSRLRGNDSLFLMNKKSIIIDSPKGDWFKLNPGESGFYRVSYEIEQIKALKMVLEQKDLPAADRLGLIRDAFALSQAGEMNTNDALELVGSLKDEEDFNVWTQMAGGLSKVADLIADEPFVGSFEKYSKEIFEEIVKKMGWEKKKGEGHMETLLRNLVLYQHGKYGDKETVKHAQKMFKEVVLTGKVLDPDLRGVVYNLVALNGGVKEHSFFIKKYKEEELQQEKDRIARALTMFKAKGLIKKTLKFSLSKDVRPQDAIFLMSAVFLNHAGSDLAWEFIKSNWKLLQDKYSGGHFLLPRLIQGTEIFRSEKKAREIETFFKKNPTPEAARTIAQVLEQIRSNAEWLKRDRKRLEKFLA